MMNQEQKLAHIGSLYEAIWNDTHSVVIDDEEWHIKSVDMSGSICLMSESSQHIIYCSPAWNEYEEREDFRDDDHIDISFHICNDDGVDVYSKLVPFEPDWQSVSGDLCLYHEEIAKHLPSILKEMAKYRDRVGTTMRQSVSNKPTFEHVAELREALEAMICSEIELEASGDMGSYDVSELSHVKKANLALKNTQSVSMKSIRLQLSDQAIASIEHVAMREGYETYSEAVMAMIEVASE